METIESTEETIVVFSTWDLIEAPDTPVCPVCGYPAERIGRCFICPNCCNSTGCD